MDYAHWKIHVQWQNFHNCLHICKEKIIHRLKMCRFPLVWISGQHTGDNVTFSYFYQEGFPKIQTKNWFGGQSKHIRSRLTTLKVVSKIPLCKCWNALIECFFFSSVPEEELQLLYQKHPIYHNGLCFFGKIILFLKRCQTLTLIYQIPQIWCHPL